MRKQTDRAMMPYDTRLTPRARELRGRPTEAEEILWKQVLRKRKLKGYKFLRQKPISMFILDFYCSKLLLGIEVDGKIHDSRKEYDEERTFVLNSLGIKVLRYKNTEVLEKLDVVAKKLEKEIENRELELARLLG